MVALAWHTHHPAPSVMTRPDKIDSKRWVARRETLPRVRRLFQEPSPFETGSK